MLLKILNSVLIATVAVISTGGALEQKDPAILIVTLVRNKAHTLPYFLSYLQNQDYNKKRISVWIRSDHNEDYTSDVLHAWLPMASELFHSVSALIDEEPKKREGEAGPFDWTDERMRDVIRLKEEAFQYAKKILADYVFFLDADVFLTDNQTLKKLTSLKLPIVAPLLDSDSLYTNFWGGMRSNFYYIRTDDYMEIKSRQKLGEFKVPLINSAILVDMNTVNAKSLTHNRTTLINHRVDYVENFDIPADDQIVFAVSARYAGLPMYISNSHKYGYILAPMPVEATLKDEVNQFINLLVYFIRDQTPPVVPDCLDEFTLAAKKSTMGLSKIFVINLDTRLERLERFSEMADIIGLDYERFSAVDGSSLTTEYLMATGVRVVPHHDHQRLNRSIRMGDVACFWSHYKVWQEVVNLGLKDVLILEDNITFKRYFKFLAESALNEARSLLKTFDIIHFGETLNENSTFVNETVPGAKYLKKPGTFISSRGYVLTLNGAKKLINSAPLQKIVPIDEYFSIICDTHPDEKVKKYFSKRNVETYAVEPSIVEDSYERLDPKWMSDTKQSKEIESIEKIYAEIPFIRDEL